VSKKPEKSKRLDDAGAAIYLPDSLTDMQRKIVMVKICNAFDASCEKNNLDYFEDKEMSSHINKNHLIEVILFPLDFMLALLIHGFSEAKAKYELIKIQFGHLTGKYDTYTLLTSKSVLAKESVERIKDKAYDKFISGNKEF